MLEVPILLRATQFRRLLAIVKIIDVVSSESKILSREDHRVASPSIRIWNNAMLIAFDSMGHSRDHDCPNLLKGNKMMIRSSHDQNRDGSLSKNSEMITDHRTKEVRQSRVPYNQIEIQTLRCLVQGKPFDILCLLLIATVLGHQFTCQKGASSLQFRCTRSRDNPLTKISATTTNPLSLPYFT
jgi:hypothetical protein